jgi:hypothetical protein
MTRYKQEEISLLQLHTLYFIPGKANPYCNRMKATQN